MAIVLIRAFASVHDLLPGEYHRHSAGNGVGMSADVTIRCPGCGQLVWLEHPEVDGAGVLTPCFNCPHDDCALHEWLVLDGWSYDL